MFSAAVALVLLHPQPQSVKSLLQLAAVAKDGDVGEAEAGVEISQTPLIPVADKMVQPTRKGRNSNSKNRKLLLSCSFCGLESSNVVPCLLRYLY